MRRGEQLVVWSKVDMDDWRIQQNRKTAIYINDDVWCLVGKQYTAAKGVQYLLNPWPEVLKEIPGRRIRYDEEYVKTRNEAEKKRKLEAGIGPILFHLRSLIGFLPSGIKSRIEENFGVPTRSATLMSIIVELLLFFLLGAFLQISVFGAMRLSQMAVYIPMFIVPILILFVDLAMRYDSYLREDESPLGLFEWAFRRRDFRAHGFFVLFGQICKRVFCKKKWTRCPVILSLVRWQEKDSTCSGLRSGHYNQAPRSLSQACLCFPADRRLS